ncbi:thiamine-phosphate kinase [Aneurinibacillus terranovensis]|uniref:thiamine-phosphate kinase n=1 Tax=Aneurinibacillus terranovensis TaxID=278991 RepID=UPI000409A221|nr:thiamine-phosphate kinase [Aneurinibacillus terranovensis]
MKRRRDEFELIGYLTAEEPLRADGPPVQSRVVVGNGDDAAVVSGRDGYDWVVCCDTMVEGIHFKRRTMMPYDIGWKALASNISDIAAMGGIPLFYLVSLGVSAEWSEEELKEMYRGMADIAAQHQMALIGGDTVASPGQLTITVTALGEVEKGRKLLRSNARPGDLVFVTGTVGDSAAGLQLLLKSEGGAQGIAGGTLANSANPANATDPADSAGHVDGYYPLVVRHCRPEPQVKAGRLLADSGIRVALNDISDGLASEVWEMAEASQVKIVLEQSAIPLSGAIRSYAAECGQDMWPWVWYGGEDYQLVGCVPSEAKERLTLLFRDAGLPLYWIGRVGEKTGSVTEFSPVEVDDGHGKSSPLPKKGYNHFKGRGSSKET